jgi:hypothetical protein
MTRRRPTGSTPKDYVLRSFPRATSISPFLKGMRWEIWHHFEMGAFTGKIAKPRVLGTGFSAVRAWEDAAVTVQAELRARRHNRRR